MTEELVQAGISALASKASKFIDQATERIEQDVDRVGDAAIDDDDPMLSAGTSALQASLSGNNPVWAALKGAWSGASTTTKVVVVAILVLLLVLMPVLLVLGLLTLLIVAVVAAIRAAAR